MKKIIFTLFIFSFSFSLSAQSYFWDYKAGTTYDSISGKKIKLVEKITEYKYDSKELCDLYIKNTSYAANGEFEFSVNIKKDSKGKMVSADTTYAFVDSLLYNAAGQVKEKITYQNGKQEESCEYEYNDKNQIVKKTLLSDKSLTTYTYVYDDKGREIEYNVIFPSDTMNNYQYIYKYEDGDLLSEVTENKKDFPRFTYYSYKYDSEKRMTEEYYEGHHKSYYGYYGDYYYSKYNYKRLYEYDAKGSLAKETYQIIPSEKNVSVPEPDITTYEYIENKDSKILLVKDDMSSIKYIYSSDGMLKKEEYYPQSQPKPLHVTEYSYKFY